MKTMPDDVVERLRWHVQENPVFYDVVGQPFRPCPPCSDSDVAAAEQDLGFVLPDVFRDIYTQVANGGFGPGYGVMGVGEGFKDDLGQDIVECYGGYRQGDPEDPNWIWPAGWVPICHWGCIVYSVVDCLTPPYPVSFADISAKDPDEAMETILHPHKLSFAQWLSDWMDGKDLWNDMRR
jgi:hypothetical protein